MMTPLDFYAAITPDCSLVHGMGAGVHMEVKYFKMQFIFKNFSTIFFKYFYSPQVTEKEVDEGKFYMDKSPLSKSVLNDIGSQGILTL